MPNPVCYAVVARPLRWGVAQVPVLPYRSSAQKAEVESCESLALRHFPHIGPADIGGHLRSQVGYRYPARAVGFAIALIIPPQASGYFGQ